MKAASSKEDHISAAIPAPIPQTIRDIIGDQPFTKDEIGMSDSQVFMFPDCVLKVQKKQVEARNEAALIRWLEARANADSAAVSGRGPEKAAEAAVSGPGPENADCAAVSKRSAENAVSARGSESAAPYIPCPKVLAFEKEGGLCYTLMSRIRGHMLCDDSLLDKPDLLLDIMADALKRLWSVDVTDCPARSVSPLSERLKTARFLVEHNLDDTEDVEPETYGPNGFKDHFELLEWLETHRPEEDIVLTHGDFCLPNLFEKDGAFAGFIDMGKAGPADRWQDLAIALRSLKSNFAGEYGGRFRMDFTPDMLLSRLGIPMDEEKNRYYKLLDELF